MKTFGPGSPSRRRPSRIASSPSVTSGELGVRARMLSIFLCEVADHGGVARADHHRVGVRGGIDQVDIREDGAHRLADHIDEAIIAGGAPRIDDHRPVAY